MKNEEEKMESCFEDKGKSVVRYSDGMCGGFYGLGFLGALVYYLQHADTFWVGVIGLLKAIIWPAMLIYKIFTMLNM